MEHPCAGLCENLSSKDVKAAAGPGRLLSEPRFRRSDAMWTGQGFQLSAHPSLPISQGLGLSLQGPGLLAEGRGIKKEVRDFLLNWAGGCSEDLT